MELLKKEIYRILNSRIVGGGTCCCGISTVMFCIGDTVEEFVVGYIDW